MSEFSESYHLRTSQLQDGVSLLRKAKLPGFVFDPVSDWATILPAGEVFSLNQPLIRANTGLLLRYHFAEDHGWGFTVFSKALKIGHFDVDWSMGLKYKQPCTVESLKAVMPKHSAKQLTAIAAALNTTDFESALGDHNARRFADAVGLAHWSWLSYESAVSDYGDPARVRTDMKMAKPQHPADSPPYMIGRGTK